MRTSIVLWACSSALYRAALACSDFMMDFSAPAICLSVRTNDMTSMHNYTITSWPSMAASDSMVYSHPDISFSWRSKYRVLGVSGNYLGDDAILFPSFIFDGLNEQGLSCSMLALIGTEYEDPAAGSINIFYGVFCKYIMQQYASVEEVLQDIDGITIYGPKIVAEHFVIRDSTGTSMVIELVNKEKRVYVDRNDGMSGYGIMTNEPAFDYHLTNIEHYEWKRSLSRQAVPVPGMILSKIYNRASDPRSRRVLVPGGAIPSHSHGEAGDDRADSQP